MTGTDAITFTVAAVPVAQPRQRHRIVTTAGGGAFVSNYTPKRDPVNGFKAAVALAAQQAHGDAGPLEGPLRLELLFIMPRPGYLCWKTKAMPRQWHVAKPDADNLAKSVKDALTGVLWRDDCQIARLVVGKQIAAGGESPGVTVAVLPLQVDLPDEAQLLLFGEE